jgi:hypothetical protein
MAICEWCNQEMLTADGCTNNTVEYPDGEVLASIPYEHEDANHRCHDCNVKVGQYHHPGCDNEICGRCGGQLISCGCLNSPEDDEDEDWD